MNREYLAAAMFAAAAASDLATGRIPNRLIASFIATGLLWQIAGAGQPEASIAWTGKAGCGIALYGVRAAGMAAALFAVCYLTGMLGAGDIKCMAAIAGILPVREAAAAVGLSLAAGACIGVAVVAAKLAGRNISGIGPGGRVHFTPCMLTGFLAAIWFRR